MSQVKILSKIFPTLFLILLLSLCTNQKTHNDSLKNENNEEKKLIEQKRNQQIDSLLTKYNAKKIDLFEDDYYRYTFELQEKIKNKETIGFEFYYDGYYDQDIFKTNKNYILEIQVDLREQSSFLINIEPSIFETIKKTQYGFMIVRINDFEMNKGIKAYYHEEEMEVYQLHHISFKGICIDYFPLD